MSCFLELKRWPRVQLKTESLANKAANTNLRFQKLPDIAVQAQQKAPLDALRKFLEGFTGPVIFSVESEGRREALWRTARPYQSGAEADIATR